MVKLVAFDWNGTIFADTYAILESVNEIFKSVNLKSISLTTFQKHFDVPVRNTYLALGIPKEIVKREAELAKIFHSFYEIRVAKVRTRAYAKNLLAWLFKKNIKSIIFSNHIDEPIKKQLKRLKIEKYFSEVLANSYLETALKGRSKHEKLLSFIKNNNLSAQEILLVGDTVEEIEIGKELGAITVAITHGNCSTARLKVIKPDYLINSLKDVIDIIKEKNSQSYYDRI